MEIFDCYLDVIIAVFELFGNYLLVICMLYEKIRVIQTSPQRYMNVIWLSSPQSLIAK